MTVLSCFLRTSSEIWLSGLLSPLFETEPGSPVDLSTPFKIRSDVQEVAALKEMHQAWKSRYSTNDVTLFGDDVTVVTDPFRACVVKNFIGDTVPH